MSDSTAPPPIKPPPLIPPPKLSMPNPVAAPAKAFADNVFGDTQSGYRSPRALKIEAPSNPKKLASTLSDFFAKLAQNKRALAGIGVVVAIFIFAGFWTSHSSHRNHDLHVSENASRSDHETSAPSTGGELPSAEQVASRFETVFQKVQSDSGDAGDVSR